MKRMMAAVDQSGPALGVAELATNIGVKFEAELVLLTMVGATDRVLSLPTLVDRGLSW
jgi:hypothetical protein